MKTHVTHMGTATILLELGNLSIVTDPVFDPAGSSHHVGPGAIGQMFRYSRLAEAVGTEHLPKRPDVVLVSHDHHGDNLDAAGLEYARKAGIVITTESGARRLARKGLTNVRGLRPWQQIDLGELKVTATPARHGPWGTDFITGDVVGFFIEHHALNNGPIYVTGDTRWFGGTAQVATRLPRPGTIFAHVGAARFLGLHFSMNGTEARHMADALKPEQVIPIHYDRWSHFSEGISALGPAFEGTTTKLRILARGRRERLWVDESSKVKTS